MGLWYVIDDYQGLLYTIHTTISGWKNFIESFMSCFFWIEQFYPVLIKPSKLTFRHQKNFNYRAVLSRLKNTNLEMIYLRIRESLKFLFLWKHVVYLAHVIEQLNFRIPNPQYLQLNFCFDFFNDSENTFWGFFEI